MNLARLWRFIRDYPAIGLPVAVLFLGLMRLWKHRKHYAVLVCLYAASELPAHWLSAHRIQPTTPMQTSSTQQTAASILDLGVLPGDRESGANALNAQGQVVGWSGEEYKTTHAFAWQEGKMQDLGAGNGSSVAYSINNKGQMVGENEGNACLWRNGKAQSLGALPGYAGGSARAISNKGDIAGYCYHSPTIGKAFRWQKGNMTPIEPTGDDDYTLAAGINDRSTVVGESANEWGDTRAFVNVVGSRYAELLPTIGGPNNAATAINNRDQIVGLSNHLRGDAAAFHAFCWQNGKLRDLGVLGGTRSAAFAINDKGQIAGWSEASGYKQHAFLWENGRMSDLNALLPKNSGWILERAMSINDKGQIVGTGLHNGQRRAFLLTLNSR